MIYTPGRNLIRNLLHPDVSAAAKYPMLVGQTANSGTETNITASVATHGIRLTATADKKRPILRLGTNSTNYVSMNGLVAGETYTWSFDYTCKLFSGATSGTKSFYLRIYDDRTTTGTFGGRSIGNIESYSSGYGEERSGHAEITFTIPANVTMLYFYFFQNSDFASLMSTGDFIEIRNLKLEFGSTATPYSPAPEDAVTLEAGDDPFTPLARTGLTVSIQRDIDSVTWYYLLQSSTLDPPVKPTTLTPPSGWSTFEPTYTEGSTNSLYRVEKTVFTDGSFDYSDVCLDSSYEAAKAAYNKALAAKNAADEVSPELIIGTQSSSTASWTGTSSRITVLSNGLRILYKLPYAGKSNVTLNLTLANGTATGAIPCYYTGTTRLGTQYGANAVIELVYDDSTPAWRVANPYTNSNNYDRSAYKASVTASGPIAVGRIGVFDSSGVLMPLSTTPFDTTYPILYVGTAYTASALTQTNNYTMWGTPFSLANTKSGFTGTAGKPVYIKGVLNGTMFTPDAEIFTTTVPTAADGKVYIRLGLMSTTENAVLEAEHPKYIYHNGAFKAFESIVQTHDTQIISANGKLALIMTDAEQAAWADQSITMTSKVGTVESTVSGIVTKFSSFETAYGDTFVNAASKLAEYKLNADEFLATVSRMNYLTTGIVSETGANLITGTEYPDVSDPSRYPRLIGQNTLPDTSGGTKTTAVHGIRITGASRPYFRLGRIDEENRGLHGLEAGETYTLSFDASWKVLSSPTGMANTTTYYMRAYLYDDHNNPGTIAGNFYNTFGTVEQADKGTEMTGSCEFTFTLASNVTMMYVIIYCTATTQSYYAADDYMEIRNLKLEKGSSATAWSPSPAEFIESKISGIRMTVDGLESTVSAVQTNLAENYSTTTEMNSAINQKAGEITAAVSSTYATQSALGTLEARMSSAELKITDSAIVSTVRTFAHNLIQNSTGYSLRTDGWEVESAYASNLGILAVKFNDPPVNGMISSHALVFEGKTSYQSYARNNNVGKLKQGTKYTFSGYYHLGSNVKTSESDALTDYIDIYYLSLDNPNVVYTGATVPLMVSNAWTPFEVTFTTRSFTASGQISPYIRVHHCGLTNASLTTGNYIHFSDLMLVEGETKLPWSDHPLDISSQIVQTASEIRLKADILVWTATNSSLDSTGALTINSATIGGIHANSTSIYSGSHTAYNSANQGFYLDKDGKFGIGNNTHYLRWDGNTTLSIKGDINATSGSFTGSITAGSGSIAGWDIDSTSLTSSVTVSGGTIDKYETKLSKATANISSLAALQIQRRIKDTGQWLCPLQILHDGTIISRAASGKTARMDSGSFRMLDAYNNLKMILLEDGIGFNGATYSIDDGEGGSVALANAKITSDSSGNLTIDGTTLIHKYGGHYGITDRTVCLPLEIRQNDGTVARYLTVQIRGGIVCVD